MNDTPAVLFVCTANLCRSPMAMALFAYQLTKSGQGDGWRVESAGTWAADGTRVPRKVELVMAEWGLDLRSHRARTVSRRLLQEFDLVLTMTVGHREALNVEFPEAASRVCLLSEMAGSRHDIPDPINGSLEDIRAVAYEIALLLNSGFERIRWRVAGRRDNVLQRVRV